MVTSWSRRALDLDLAVDQHLAGTVHRDEIGGAVALAGDDDDAAVLQRHIGDQRVADDDGGDSGGKFDELRLIDIDRDSIGVGCGQADRRPRHNGDCKRRKAETRGCANTLGT